LYYLNDQYELAIADYTAALYYAPGNPWSYLSRATCKIMLEDYENGCRDYHSAIKNGLHATDEYKTKTPAELAYFEAFFEECGRSD
jgi:hypothetical protein